MLAIISDLHLTDGTGGATINPGAFEIFVERVNDLAFRASWRADGKYRPVEQINLLLLGDVLDIIRSASWLQSNVRPWDDPHSTGMVQTVTSIVDEILAHNSRAVKTLRWLTAEGAIQVPPATRTGQPDFNAELWTVEVQTHYMVGNHDWHLHLPGHGYNLIRQKVVEQLGLANAYGNPFPHDPMECPELLETLRRHRVFARHGDIFDPINFTEDRDTSSLGDAIVVELMGRFATELTNQVDESDLSPAVVTGLRELDNVRPTLLVPVWIDGMLQRSCTSPVVRKQIKRVWDRLADDFLQLPIVHDRDTWSPFDLVDGLENALKFSKRLSIGWASKIATWLHSLRGSTSDSFYRHAMAEQDFRNRRARHIVYGHTHSAETIPLDASYADEFVLNQMYFNSGTWRRVHRPTVAASAEHEFIPQESMTYLSFFEGDERSGRPFETWSGTLGVQSATARSSRGKGPSTGAAAHQPVAGVHPPHFIRTNANQPATREQV